VSPRHDRRGTPTPLHAFALAEVIHEAGLPLGVINVVPAEREASAALVRTLAWIT